MPGPSAIFEFLVAEASAGHSTALVTVVSVSGASVRNPGSHMAVSSGGAVLGSLSGGCIEAAVIGEALEAISAGRPRLLSYGAGSPIIDIRLPCGGSVDLLVSPLFNLAWVSTIRDQFTSRQEVRFQLATPDGCDVHLRHAPRLRVVIYGHGGSVEALAALAKAVDVEVLILTPDQYICARNPGCSVLLSSPSSLVTAPSDRWTAHVFYFHDHDWEAQFLAQTLALPRLYVGAMGSLKTHDARREELLRLGVSQSMIAQIRAPIGLIPSSRDPETLALSTLTEIVDAYNRLGIVGID